MQFGYQTRLERDTKRWIEKELIDADTADAIVAESRSQKSGYSFSSVVIILGVISLCFAAMTFVAANWDEMPKIMRVSILLAGMAIAYLASVLANQRGKPIIADAFVLLGCGVFGATIMLVGQMYHMQGRAQDAVLLWAGGSLLAALVLRASTALWLAIALFGLWVWFGSIENFDLKEVQINLLYLVFWFICAALAWWLRSRMSAHLLLVSIIGWIFLTVAILTERYDTSIYAAGLYAFWYVVIAIAIFSNDQGQWLRGAEAVVIRYSALIIFVISAIWIASGSSDLVDPTTVDFFSNRHLLSMAAMLLIALAILAFAMKQKSLQIYDLAFCAIWIAVSIFVASSIGVRIPFLADAFGIAISIWFIRMGARQDIPAVTRLGYFGFVLIMLLIYFRTAQSLLGTTGFYLTAGILMVAGAIFLPKLFRAKKTEQEAA